MMSKYLLKFTKKQFLPNFSDLRNTSLKIGTFHHYRNIENNILRDDTEGQQGLSLKIRKPCPKLDELKNRDDSYIFYDQSSLNKFGEFKADFYLQIYEHLKEFNAWLFCCTYITDLKEINDLKSYFNCDSYFFITDVDRFANSIQRSLVTDLKDNPFIASGEKRVICQDGEVYIDGFKNRVTYADKDKWLNRECNTLTEFLDTKGSREVDQNLWFQKLDRFSIEKEVRFIYFPTSGRSEQKRYCTRDDFIILSVDLTNCISQEPKTYRKPEN